MPNIEFSDTKGLTQQTGTGVTFASSTVNFISASLDLKGTSILKGDSRNLVVSSSTAYPDNAITLGVGDAGTIIHLDNQTTETTINLPAGGNISAGTYFKFVPLSNNTNTYIIKRGTNGELITGGFAVISDTNDKNALASSLATNDILTLDGTASNTVAGAIGSVVHCLWDGTAWRVWGHLISSGNAPSSVAPFSNG